MLKDHGNKRTNQPLIKKTPGLVDEGQASQGRDLWICEGDVI